MSDSLLRWKAETSISKIGPSASVDVFADELLGMLNRLAELNAKVADLTQAAAASQRANAKLGARAREMEDDLK